MKTKGFWKKELQGLNLRKDWWANTNAIYAITNYPKVGGSKGKKDKGVQCDYNGEPPQDLYFKMMTHIKQGKAGSGPVSAHPVSVRELLLTYVKCY